MDYLEGFGYKLIDIFKTSASLSVDIVSDRATLAKGATVGWIDIHYPCQEEARIRVHASVPQALAGRYDIAKLVLQIAIQLVGAKPDETYEMRIFTASNIIRMENSDLIATSKKYILPSSNREEIK